MNKRTTRSALSTALVLSFLLAAIGATLHAQEYRLVNLQVAPANEAAFEQAVKAYHAALRKSKFDRQITAGITDNGHYLFITPLAAQGGEREAYQASDIRSHADRMMKAAEYRSISTVTARPDLSYTPKAGSLDPKNIRFAHYRILYLKPGTEAQAESFFTRLAEHARNQDHDYGYSVAVAQTGPELPMMIMVSYGTDEVDHETRLEASRKKTGNSLDALNAELAAVLRRMEKMDVRIRPDLATHEHIRISF